MVHLLPAGAMVVVMAERGLMKAAELELDEVHFLVVQLS
jgi:hypothetical protein